MKYTSFVYRNAFLISWHDIAIWSRNLVCVLKLLLILWRSVKADCEIRIKFLADITVSYHEIRYCETLGRFIMIYRFISSGLRTFECGSVAIKFYAALCTVNEWPNLKFFIPVSLFC